MSPDLPTSTVDFEWALNACDLDSCLHRLRIEESAELAAAERNCRLAEALFHAGRRNEALECGSRAFDIAGNDSHILDLCAWLFSNSGCHAEAAEAYRRLVSLQPDWADGYRHASGSLAAIGAVDEAIAYALGACELARSSAELAVHAAELLQRAGRFDEAASVLYSNAAEATPDPTLLRVLSGVEMLRGRIDAALAAIAQAITRAPDRAEYHLHRAHLLLRRHDRPEAAAAIGEAAAIAPDDPAVRRARIALLAADGRLVDATALAGSLIHDHPEDEASAETVRQVLDLRRDLPEGDEIIVTHGFRQKRALRPPPGLLSRLATQRRVIRALVIRETRTRFGESRLGYGWALLEPVLHISLLSIVFAIVMHGNPPIGSEFFIFYFTGLLPYHVFVHASSAMGFAITGNAPLLQLPLVTTFDVIVARGILEFVTDVIVAVLMLVGFAAVGLQAIPAEFWTPATALAATAALGFGMGFVNAVVTVFVRSWDRIYAQVTRALYFCSGIFYVPGMMPDWVRDLFGWNPLLHAIDWFRSGFFETYQPHWLDRRYLLIAALIAMVAGLTLHAAFRRRLSEPL